MPHSFKDSKPLRVEEEHDLLRKAQAGDMAARSRLIQANLRYVVKLAHTRAFRSANDSNFEDYIQEGLLALHIAIDKFDFTKTDKTMRLIGYAHSWIKVRQGNRAVSDMSLVKFGTTQAQRTLFSSLRRATEELTYLFRRDPTDEELATHMRVKPHEIADARMRINQRDLSLNTRVGDEGGFEFLENVLSHNESAEQQYMSAEERRQKIQEINRALGRLDSRERYVIEKRHLCDSDDEMTLAEIGIRWGCSRERVRQIELRAFMKLQKFFGVPQNGNPFDGRGKKSKGRNKTPDGDGRAPGREVFGQGGRGQTASERGEGGAVSLAGTPAGCPLSPPHQSRELGAHQARGSGDPVPRRRRRRLP